MKYRYMISFQCPRVDGSDIVYRCAELTAENPILRVADFREGLSQLHPELDIPHFVPTYFALLEKIPSRAEKVGYYVYYCIVVMLFLWLVIHLGGE